MADRLKGQVAEILNSRELVINIGVSQGVKVGMKFKVCEPAHEVLDPVTKESLGRIDREKIKVKVVEVFEKLSLARTYETYEETPFDYSTLDLNVRNYLSTSSSATRVRTLRVTDQKAPFDPLDEKSSFVKIGDLVIQTLE